MYWSILGFGDPSDVQLGEGFHSGFTVRVGYIVFGAYNMCATIVLLNMLIAMMTRSFDEIHVSMLIHMCHKVNAHMSMSKASLNSIFSLHNGHLYFGYRMMYTWSGSLHVLSCIWSIFRMGL